MQYLIFLPLLFALSCTAPTVTSTAPAPAPTETMAETYAGDWDVTVSDTPAGTVKGILTITDSGDGMSGSFSSQGKSTDLRSVERTDAGLLIKFYSDEYQTDIDIRLNGGPGEETLSGSTLGSFETVATRKM